MPTKDNAYECVRELRAHDAVDAHEKGARVAMSSEDAVRTYIPGIGPAMEILEHTQSAIRLDRLNDGAAVLINHSPMDYAGKVTKAWIDNDRTLRGEVAFADTEAGHMLGRNVPGGFHDKASIGYRVYKYELSEQESDDELPTVRATDWEPYELSFVSVPADTRAGVGRSLTTIEEDQEMPEEKKAADTGGQKDTKITITKDEDDKKRERSETTDKLAQLSEQMGKRMERERQDAIRNLTEQFSYVEDLGERGAQAIANDMPASDFERIALDAVAEHVQRAPKAKQRGYLDMGDNDRARYSFARALQAAWAIRTGEGNPATIAPHEMSISAELARGMDHREASGVLIPPDVLESGTWPIPRFASPAMEDQYRMASLMGQRAAPMGVGTAGTQASSLVGTQLMAGSFIEALRPSTVVLAAGATVMSGLTSNISIPKQTGTGTAYWVGEDTAPTETETPIGLVNMQPRSIAADIPITRKMMLQSTPAVENIVRSDLVGSIAEKLDYTAFEGDGTGASPLGIINHPDVLTQAVGTDTTPTWAEVVGFITTVREQNALRAGGAFVCTPTIAGAMMTTTKDSGSGQFLMGDNGMVAGYPSFQSSQLATSRLMFGCFSQWLVGQWGVLDIMVDIYSAASTRRTVLRVTQDVDMAARHGQSFCYGT